MSQKALRLQACAGTALTALVLAGFGTGARAAPAAAPQASEAGNTIQEVVVTARKREESLQSVPVAVTSLTGNQLAQQGVREGVDLQRAVPSLTSAMTPINANTSQATGVVFSLRGQASGDVLLTMSQPVGVYIDSANVPHPDGLNGELFDIQRVEVLKGPQGTLYGRNTTGGAINIITRGADYNGIHGFVSGEAGDYSDWRVNGAVNVPIVKDMLAVRLAYQHWNRNGYGKSITTGQDLGGDHNDDLFRVSVRFDPVANLTSTTKVEYARMLQHGYLQTLVAAAAGNPTAELEANAEGGSLAPWLNNKNIFQVGSQTLLFDKVKVWHMVEDATWTINDYVNLRSISGFHSVSDFPKTDLDGTPFQILEIFAGAGGTQPIVGPRYTVPLVPENKYRSYTQEFDLSGHAFGRLDWLVGAFGSWENGYGGEPYIPFGRLLNGFVSTTTESQREDTSTWALFTQNDLHITDRVGITFGARYTEEKVKNRSLQFNWQNNIFLCPNGTLAPGNNANNCPTIVQSEKSNGISYLLSFNFQFTPDTLFYVKTSRGFRGGALQFRAAGFPSVEPEIAIDYEAGLKSDFFTHRLRTNLAVYHTNYKNKQEQSITTVCGNAVVAPLQPTCPGGDTPHSTTVLKNAANAKVDGFEGEVTAVPITGLTLSGNVTWLRGVYEHFPEAFGPDGNLVNGSGLPFQDPPWRYGLGARYQHDAGPGVLGGSLDWAWRAHNKLTALNISPSFPLALQKKLNASVGLLNGRIDYTLPRQGVTVAVWSTNLLNKHYQTEALFSAALGIATATTQAPRMFGVTITKSFGEE